MADPKVKLLYEWEVGKERYRLLAKANWTPGYEDAYYIEKLGQDTLGEPRWDMYHHWSGNEGANRYLNLMIAALKGMMVDTERMKTWDS